jgi:hypothetical protein
MNGIRQRRINKNKEEEEEEGILTSTTGFATTS